MALSYYEIVSGLESEFFLARIRSQVTNIDDPEELRTIVMALVELLQHQRDTFLGWVGGEDVDPTDTLIGSLFSDEEAA